MLAEKSGQPSGSGDTSKGIQQVGNMFMHSFTQCFEHVTCQALFQALGTHQ